jgi:hypothetical protein
MVSVVAERNLPLLNRLLKEGNLHDQIMHDILSNDMALNQVATIIEESGFKLRDDDSPSTAAEMHHLLVNHLRAEIDAARQNLEKIPKSNKRAREKALEKLLAAVGRLNRYNKTITESLQRMDMLPHPQNIDMNSSGVIGLTIHAGEQVARTVQGNTSVLGRLMDDIELAITSGTDRIGHGVILGLSFDPEHAAKTMEMLGFTRVEAKKGKPAHWRRGGEKYTDAQVAELETRRLAALQRVASQGITLEVPPTSNIILNNLGLQSHPVLKMMQDVSPPPVLRVSVSTDNPGIHNINTHSELSLLISMGVTWPQAVRIVAEGFASRMGSRPILAKGDIDMRERMVRGILESTPISEAPAVLKELALRFPGVVKNNPIPDQISDRAEFERWLRQFVIAAMGSGKNKPAT